MNKVQEIIAQCDYANDTSIISQHYAVGYRQVEHSATPSHDIPTVGGKCQEYIVGEIMSRVDTVQLVKDTPQLQELYEVVTGSEGIEFVIAI